MSGSRLCEGHAWWEIGWRMASLGVKRSDVTSVNAEISASYKRKSDPGSEIF